MPTHTKSLTARRRAVAILGIVAVLAAGLPAAASATGPQDPFLGTYRSIDFDGSNQTIAFGGPGNIRRVVYLDDVGTICGGDRFFAEGIGFVEGNTIMTFLEQYCGNAKDPFGGLALQFQFDPDTGLLTDDFNIVWSRN